MSDASPSPPAAQDEAIAGFMERFHDAFGGAAAELYQAGVRDGYKRGVEQARKAMEERFGAAAERIEKALAKVERNNAAAPWSADLSKLSPSTPARASAPAPPPAMWTDEELAKIRAQGPRPPFEPNRIAEPHPAAPEPPLPLRAAPPARPAPPPAPVAAAPPPVAPALSSPPPRPTQPPPPPAAQKPDLGERLTPARRALLEREWPAGVATDLVLARFNRLSGRALDKQQLGILANEIGLRRPTGFNWRTAKQALAGPDDDALIAKHIAEKGVTKLPAAAAEVTSATLPPEDRAAIRKHDDARAEAYGSQWPKTRKVKPG